MIEGVIAFEIIYDYDESHQATSIVAFKEIDPITLEPSVTKDLDGNILKVWYQNRGSATDERIIPDSNLIYIS